MPDYKNAGSRLPEVTVGILEHSWQTSWEAGYENPWSLTLRNKASAFGNVAAEQNGKKPLPLNDLAASIEVIS
ncbi:hypothetical protein [Rhodoferax sp. TS-BS-61-7]|uniref:hypothetical protein n=1 Tax=Rhodoferax sp. TS-BS-61-7 TaxID=2094194 RepID=UPI0011B08A9F|nr:hypothetical protein [Rhodoferax sp. TS-BS-61-7]